MPRSVASRRRASSPVPLRLLLIAGFAFGAAATVMVVLFADQVRWLRIATLLALWAALIAAFAVARSRRETQQVTLREGEIARTYELELQREVSARREYEAKLTERVHAEVLAVHQQIAERDGELAAANARELAAVREQLARLSEALTGILDGDVLIERLTLSAESTRLRGVTDAGRRRLLGTGDGTQDVSGAAAQLVVEADQVAQVPVAQLGVDQPTATGTVVQGATDPVTGPASPPGGQGSWQPVPTSEGESGTTSESVGATASPVAQSVAAGAAADGLTQQGSTAAVAGERSAAGVDRPVADESAVARSEADQGADAGVANDGGVAAGASVAAGVAARSEADERVAAGVANDGGVAAGERVAAGVAARSGADERVAAGVAARSEADESVAAGVDNEGVGAESAADDSAGGPGALSNGFAGDNQGGRGAAEGTAAGNDAVTAGVTGDGSGDQDSPADQDTPADQGGSGDHGGSGDQGGSGDLDGSGDQRGSGNNLAADPVQQATTGGSAKVSVADLLAAFGAPAAGPRHRRRAEQD